MAALASVNDRPPRHERGPGVLMGEYVPVVTGTALSRLVWTTSADRRALSEAGYTVVEFGRLRTDVARWTRAAGQQRRSLATPAAGWLRSVAEARGLALVGVRLDDVASLAVLHGYVLEPAWRARTPLLVECEQRLSRLPAERFVDDGFGYPYTLQRAFHTAMRLHRGEAEARSERVVPAATVSLDAEQRVAVEAHDGVVQVIAPAGSGKTTVLIERVRELLRRGTPAEKILCTTFSRDARVELQERLAAARLGQVEARTFHSLGLWLLREERLARRNGTRQLSLGQWKRLCAVAGRDTGVWVDAADTRGAISEIKLGLLFTPREFRPRAEELPDGAALARIYELYEQQLAEQGINDFDDHVLLAVRALREDGELRQRWQSRFPQVLVDEYQDIEPAQELLVRILGAPHDGFFCVGDEDQTLYGWRRASVRRMIDLDLSYPGLQRVSLAHNYRCPPEIVEASRRLIAHNKIRFPKAIHPAPGRASGGDRALRLQETARQAQAAERIARGLASRRRGQIVVLARTTNLLRTVALACVDAGVMISAPEPVFEPRGARRALEPTCGCAATLRTPSPRTWRWSAARRIAVCRSKPRAGSPRCCAMA
jgi:hypothetical protein